VGLRRCQSRGISHQVRRPACSLPPSNGPDYGLPRHQHDGPLFLFNSTKATISTLNNSKPGPNQPTQLENFRYVSDTLISHTNTSLRFSWFKHNDAPMAYRNIRVAALRAAKGPTDPGKDTVSINHQRQAAQAEAIRSWEERWHENPRTSLAYRTACTKPPDGRLHPILRIQHKGWKSRGLLYKAKVSRMTSSTMFRFITGYAFTGEYAARFLGRRFNGQLLEQLVACPCGELPQTIKHVLLECPQYEVARQILRHTRQRPVPRPTFRNAAAMHRSIEVPRINASLHEGEEVDLGPGIRL